MEMAFLATSIFISPDYPALKQLQLAFFFRRRLHDLIKILLERIPMAIFSEEIDKLFELVPIDEDNIHFQRQYLHQQDLQDLQPHQFL